MNLSLFLVGFTFLLFTLLRGCISSIITLLGIEGMKELCNNNSLNHIYVNDLFKNAFLSVDFMLMTSYLSVIYLTTEITDSVILKSGAWLVMSVAGYAYLNYGRSYGEPAPFHYVAYHMSAPLSIRMWAMHLAAITVLQCWSSITCASIVCAAFMNLIVVYLKMCFQPHTGWMTLRSMLKKNKKVKVRGLLN